VRDVAFLVLVLLAVGEVGTTGGVGEGGHGEVTVVVVVAVVMIKERWPWRWVEQVGESGTGVKMKMKSEMRWVDEMGLTTCTRLLELELYVVLAHEPPR
jgi:hypothetical protein